VNYLATLLKFLSRMGKGHGDFPCIVIRILVGGRCGSWRFRFFSNNKMEPCKLF